MSRLLTVSVQERATGRTVFSGARPASSLAGTDTEVLARLGFDPTIHVLLRRRAGSPINAIFGPSLFEDRPVRADGTEPRLTFRRSHARAGLATDAGCRGLRTALFHPLEGIGDAWDSAVLGAMIRSSVEPATLALYVGRPETIPLARKFLYQDRPVFDQVLTWTPRHGSWQKGAALERPKWDLFLDWRTYVGRAYLMGEELPAELPELYERSFEEVFSEATNALARCGRTVHDIASESMGLALIQVGAVTIDAPSDDEVSGRLRKQIGDGRFVTLSAGSGKTKMWSPEQWAEVCAEIKARHGLDVLQVGRAGEAQVPGTKSLLGKTTLDELLWVLSRSAAHLSVENGTVRLARAVGTRSVVLFGPTSPGLHGLDGNAAVTSDVCRPCCWTTPEWTSRCALEIDAACMKAIRPEAVVRAFDELISRTAEAPAPSSQESGQERRDRRPQQFESLVVVSSGGLGDNLVALNVVRQLRGVLPDSSHVDFCSRSPLPSSIQKCMGFVDQWLTGPNEPGHLLSMKWDAVLMLRYSGRLFQQEDRDAARNYVPSLDGMRAGRHICAHLPETLGPLLFRWDGRYLGDQLRKVEPKMTERWALDRTLPRGPFVVVANGTDGSFPQRLTKRMSAEVVRRLLAELYQAGFVSVQVGLPGAAFVPAEGSVDMIGKTSLEGLVHVLRRARGLVACDNGTAHLASQMELDGLEIAVMFGPTDPVFWGYPGNLNLAPTASHCPLRPCWFAESWWHLNCVAERRGLLPTTGDVPECMRSHLDDPAAVAQMLDRLGAVESTS